MSCLLPFPASHISCPPGLLVHLSPEPLQVLKASGATSTPHRKSPRGAAGPSSSHWHSVSLCGSRTPRRKRPAICKWPLPTDVSLPSSAAVARSPPGQDAVTESTIPSWPAVRVWGEGDGGEGGPGPLLGQGPLQDQVKVNEMCKRSCDEPDAQAGRWWRVRAPRAAVNQPELV